MSVTRSLKVMLRCSEIEERSAAYWLDKFATLDPQRHSY